MRTLILILSLMIAAPVMAWEPFAPKGSTKSGLDTYFDEPSSNYQRRRAEPKPIQRAAEPRGGRVHDYNPPRHKYGGNLQQQMREDYPY